MALLTKKDFAARCNMATNKLSIYIGRGKVFCKDDLIDTAHDLNLAFLEKWSGKGETNENYKANSEAPPVNSEKAGTTTGNDDGIPPFSESERRLKFLDAEKREKEIERLKIDIDKKRAKWCPANLSNLFFFSTTSLL